MPILFIFPSNNLFSLEEHNTNHISVCGQAEDKIVKPLSTHNQLV